MLTVAACVLCALLGALVALAASRLRAARRQQPEPEAPPAEPELWRASRHATEAFLLPVPVLVEMVNPIELARARSHTDRLEAMRADVAAGIREPLVLVVDRQGRAVLEDGHHRLLLSIESDRALVPVRLKRSPHIHSWNRPLIDVLPILLAQTS